MIGQTIESRPRLPLGAIFWLTAALLLDALAIVQSNAHIAVGSLLLWLVAVLLWRLRDRPLRARFTESALEVEEPPQQVPYADLQGLLAPRRPANPFKAGPRSYAIQAIHSGGVVRIPGRLNVPSDDVFSFLFRQFSPSGSREVPNTLMDFLRHRERQFGPEQVWTYRSRTHLGRGQGYPRLKAFLLALTLSAAAWIVWGSILVSRAVQKDEGAGWIGGGVMGVMLGGLSLFLLWMDGRRYRPGRRKRRQSGLVVAPDGLALTQGDLIGELRWDEVREVKMGKESALFRFGHSTQPLRGIVLKVAGAVIVIADVYDRPLALIYQNIRHYWQGQQREDDDWNHEASPRRRIEGILPGE